MSILPYTEAVDLLQRSEVPFPPGFDLAPGQPPPPIDWLRVVLKGNAGVAHKTDLGLVALDVAPSEIEERTAAMGRRAKEAGVSLPSVRIEPYLAPLAELIVSLRREPGVGMLGLVGMGGTFAELWKDRAIFLWPIELAEFARQLGELRMAPLLRGYRGLPPVPTDMLYAMLSGLAATLEAHPEITEIELNPLALTPAGAIALDAKVTRSDHSPQPLATAVWRNLTPLLNPRSVAIVGASRDPSKLGSRLLRGLLRGGYLGRVDVLHPSEPEIQGIPCAHRFSDLQTVPDLAAIALGADETIAAVREALAFGIRRFVLHGAGFSETGSAGAARQRELDRLLRKAGAHAIGPNSQGIVSAPARLLLSFSRALEDLPPVGSLAFVSQSGAVSGTLLSRLWEEGIGLRHWIVTGTEVDVTLPDALHHFANDPGTSVVAVYLESLDDKGAFREALAECKANGKSVIVLKACRTEDSKGLSETHSGRLAGDYATYAAVIRSAGGHLAETLPQFLAALRLATRGVFPRGRRVGLVTASGGAAAALIDRAAELGFRVPPLPAGLAASLRAVLPEYVAVGHPVDLTMAYYRRPEMVVDVLKALDESAAFDVLILTLTTNADPEASAVADVVVRARERLRSPVVVVRMAAEHLAPEGLRRYREGGIAVFTMPEDAIEGLSVVAAP